MFEDLIPAGIHFFYFVKDGTQFCLSNKFDVAEYPGTNLKMNVVKHKMRNWEPHEYYVDRTDINRIKTIFEDD